MEWINSCIPNKIGWYAINYCWDVEEGSFCSSDYWNEQWTTDYPINNFAGPFENESDVLKWLEEENNDISF